MANMKEIAERCGVSIKTVSNVINQRPNVGEETRSAVLQAIRELNYVPNTQARALVLKQQEAGIRFGCRIGCILPAGVGKYDNSYFTMIFKGIEEEIVRREHQLSFIAPITELAENPLKLNHFLSPAQTDAVISFVGPGHPDFARIAALPLVLIGKQEGFESISIDKFGGVRDLVEHLASLGHTKIGYVGALHDDRFRAFRMELEFRGLPARNEWFADCAFGFAPGREAARKLLRQNELPTAIFGASDYTAIGVMHALGEAGLRVPEDVSVTGYDNLPESALVFPPLTTVDINKEGIGRLAVRTAFEQFRQPPEEHSCHTLQAVPVIRTSTGKAKK